MPLFCELELLTWFVEPSKYELAGFDRSSIYGSFWLLSLLLRIGIMTAGMVGVVAVK
jgi:hypothetical protein